MSMFTPTTSGMFFAGIGFWGTIWSALYKLETVAKIVHLERWVNRDRMFAWMNRNKVVTFLGCEAVNYALHGDSADAVVFNLGGSTVNVVMIWGFIPIRQARLEGRGPVGWLARKFAA